MCLLLDTLGPPWWGAWSHVRHETGGPRELCTKDSLENHLSEVVEAWSVVLG